MAQRRRRSRGKVDMLPPDLKSAVEQMLLSNKFSYREIVEFLANNGHTMSKQAICNYAEKFLEGMQMMSIAQENFRVMMDELERYPNLDTTEAIIRLASHHLFSALVETKPDELKEIGAEALIRQANGLVRAVSQKRRVDVQNQNDYEAGFEAAKELAYGALAKERPDLYQELSSFFNAKKKEIRE